MKVDQTESLLLLSLKYVVSYTVNNVIISLIEIYKISDISSFHVKFQILIPSLRYRNYKMTNSSESH